MKTEFFNHTGKPEPVEVDQEGWDYYNRDEEQEYQNEKNFDDNKRIIAGMSDFLKAMGKEDGDGVEADGNSIIVKEIKKICQPVGPEKEKGKMEDDGNAGAPEKTLAGTAGGRCEALKKSLEMKKLKFKQD